MSASHNPSRWHASALASPRGQIGENSHSVAVGGNGGAEERMGDGNEGANCFQWILKSNSRPQRLAKAAHKWNIDDHGENKGK